VGKFGGKGRERKREGGWKRRRMWKGWKLRMLRKLKDGKAIDLL